MDDAVVAIEAPLHRPILLGLVHWRDMPLTDHAGLITGIAQDFGDRVAARLQVVGVPGCGPGLVDHVADPGLVRILAREKRRAGRTASRAVVELREANALPGELVEIRCRD